MSIKAKVRCIGNSTPQYDTDGTSGTRLTDGVLRLDPGHSGDPRRAIPITHVRMWTIT